MEISSDVVRVCFLDFEKYIGQDVLVLDSLSTRSANVFIYSNEGLAKTFLFDGLNLDDDDGFFCVETNGFFSVVFEAQKNNKVLVMEVI